MKNQTNHTIKIFNDAALGYQEKYMDVSPYHEVLLYLCNSIKKGNPQILDVACGPGNVAKFVTDHVADVSITCTDLAPAMLELAIENIPHADVAMLDAKDITDLKRKFDAIIASFIFPYLLKEEVCAFIKDAARMLNEDGVLYISTMLGKNTDSGYVGPSNGVQMYMNYHEVEYLESALVEFGYDIILCKMQPYNYGIDNQGMDIILIGRRKN